MMRPTYRLVFTGSHPSYTRQQLTELAESKGHTVLPRVNSEANLLVATRDAWYNKTGKVKAALNKGIAVVTYEDLLEQLVESESDLKPQKR